MTHRMPLLVLAVSAPLLFAVAARADEAAGAAVFNKNCAMCHGEDGKSATPAGKAMKVPALAANEEVAKATLDDLVAHVKKIEKHAALLKKLSDEEIRNAAEHAKTLAASK